MTVRGCGRSTSSRPVWTQRRGHREHYNTTARPRTSFHLVLDIPTWRHGIDICTQAAARSVGPNPVVEEGGVMYPMHDTSTDESDKVMGITDNDASDEPGFYPGLPFELGEDFLEDIRKYLVEEEGMDEKDEQQLTIAMMRMAEDLCEMSMADDDPTLDDEIGTEIVERITPYVEAQEQWEEQQAKQKAESEQSQGLSGVSDAGDAEIDVPWVDEMGGWDTPEGMPLPENVSREAIATIMQWDKECEDTREGPRASMGWQESRGALHPSVAADIMGLKGWKLGLKVHPKLAELATNIEATWRQLFPMDLGRTHVDPRWRFVDSVDPNQVWGLDFGVEDPQLGSPQYPRLVLENRFYQTTKFRCLHLEIGLRQDGFQVLHCIMWPRREHDVPILGFDVIAIGSDVTYAIADTTSVASDGSLPPVYVDGVRLLKAQFADGIADAGLPEWGQALFSDEVVALRPALPVEADLICMHFTALLKVHILYSKFVATKVPDSDDMSLDRIDQAHRRYCDLQLKNTKTAGVLKNSFGYMGSSGDSFVDRYMTEVLFDHAFHYDVDDATKAALRENRSDLGNTKSSRTEGVATEMIEQVLKGFQDPATDSEAPGEAS